MEGSNQSRRKFLGNTAKAGLALTSLAAIPDYLAANSNATIYSPDATGFGQDPLPYAYNALEPVIDAQTMELHYSKHAATYAKNLKEAAEAEKIDTSKPLEDVLKNISKYSPKVRNNGGGHYNHELFWKSMKAQGEGKPSGKLLSASEPVLAGIAEFCFKCIKRSEGRFYCGK